MAAVTVDGTRRGRAVGVIVPIVTVLTAYYSITGGPYVEMETKKTDAH